MGGIKEGEKLERTHVGINEREIAELQIWPCSLGSRWARLNRDLLLGGLHPWSKVADHAYSSQLIGPLTSELSKQQLVTTAKGTPKRIVRSGKWISCSLFFGGTFQLWQSLTNDTFNNHPSLEACFLLHLFVSVPLCCLETILQKCCWRTILLGRKIICYQ